MIPTAEEFQSLYSIEEYDEGGYLGINEKELSKMIIEFAKLHVESALKTALSESTAEYDSEWNTCSINKESILNAYPLTNIK